MRGIFKWNILSVIIFLVFSLNTSYAVAPVIEGTWLGILKLPAGEIRVIFNISRDENNSLVATTDSPDQGVTGIPVSRVTFENDTILLEVEANGGSYEGTLKPDGTFEGFLKQRGFSLPLVLKRVGEVTKKNRPQEPKKPYPYIDQEVLIENTQAGIKLAGTLTIPHSEKPCPAVILISGSGATNRNEEVFEHKPFWILADYLTRKGIAVLRVDDRGVGSSTGNVANSTSEDFAGDVICEVNFLKTCKEIDSEKIGLIGHSEGGSIAPMVAAESSDVAFIVLLAGTGLDGREILGLQGKLILKSEGASEDVIELVCSTNDKIYEIVTSEKDNLAAEKKIRPIMADILDNLSEQDKEAMGASQVENEIQIKSILTPWFRFFLEYDPRPTLRKVQCPVLALNGSLDLQVAPKENLTAIEEALKAGGNKNYTIKELSGLNHLFQKAQTGAISEYSQIEETISPEVLEIIANWILEQTE